MIRSPLLNQARHVAAVATAFMLPLSTSGQAIAVTVFAVLALATFDRSRLKSVLTCAPAFLPALLFFCILIGVFWSMLALPSAVKWVGPYAKLLLIPLVLATPFTTLQLRQIGYGFLAACAIILGLSWASFIYPSGPWTWFNMPGVPFKDNAVQSECFALCAFGLALAAVFFWKEGKVKLMFLCASAALLFFSDLFLIYLSKTGIVVALSLLLLFVIQLSLRGAALVAAVALGVGLAIALISTSAQMRLAEIVIDLRADNIRQETVSTASRRDFWRKAYVFVGSAPIFGHGTGSIQPLYQEAETEAPSPYGRAVADPHNQFLHIVLQIGLVGGLILIAMWIVHIKLFWAKDNTSLLGLAVVLQNVLGSLFNSHLSQVTQGMLYCLAVGLIGSVVINRNRPETN